MNLDGKVALITGAASGIGKRIAEIYTEHGAAVAVADLNLGGANAAANELVQRGHRAIGVRMDVTQENEVDDGVARVIAEFGKVDILVSNAGIQIIKPVQEFTLEEWRRMQAIHVDGAFLTTRACIKDMYRRGEGGAIIYMGSVHSHEASKLKAAYVTAKHALLGLARAVAKEGGDKGVRANVICPGFVRTLLVDKQIPEQAANFGISEDEVIRNVMLKDTVDATFTTVDDVANVALFLAAFETNALSGQSLMVSHGWHMQ